MYLLDRLAISTITTDFIMLPTGQSYDKLVRLQLTQTCGHAPNLAVITFFPTIYPMPLPSSFTVCNKDTPVITCYYMQTLDVCLFLHCYPHRLPWPRLVYLTIKRHCTSNPALCSSLGLR